MAKAKNIKKAPLVARKKGTQAPKKKAPAVWGSSDLTREGWLRAAAEMLLPLVRQAAAWAGVPSTLALPPAVACSWPPGRSTTLTSTSLRSGEGWETTISPTLGQTSLEEGRTEVDLCVLAHLTHELVHCVVGDPDSHQGAFARVAAQVGLVVPLREAQAGYDLEQQVAEQVLSRIGHYPHIAVPQGAEQQQRKQDRNRQKKYVCSNCGKIVRCAGDVRALHMCEDGTQAPFVLAEKS